MHLVVYSDARARGGAEMALGLLLATLDPDIRVTVIGTDAPVVDWLGGRRRETNSIVVPPVRGKTDLVRMWEHRRVLRRLRPDIVQANLNTVHSCQYALAVATTLRGVRVIAVEHSTMAADNRLSLALKRWTSRRLAAHVSVGEGAAREVERVSGLPPGSVQVIRNAVANVDTSSAAFDVPRPIIGSIGRLEPLKGYDTLLRAAVGLDASIVLVGDGPARSDLIELADELGMAARVHLLGWQERPRDVLGGIDVFALPSRLEGLPLVVLEAMVAGLPVVATDVGSVTDAVIDGVTGVVVAVDDVAALHSALAQLLMDEPLRRRMGAAAQARVITEFAPERMARQWEQLYREVLS